MRDVTMARREFDLQLAYEYGTPVTFADMQKNYPLSSNYIPKTQYKKEYNN